MLRLIVKERLGLQKMPEYIQVGKSINKKSHHSKLRYRKRPTTTSRSQARVSILIASDPSPWPLMNL